MARPVEPPPGFKGKGKHYYSMFDSVFEIDSKYVPIKPVGRGAYGAVCSSMNKETNKKVAIKKISDVFQHPVIALRTLREMKLLRKIRHENVIALEDVMMPARRSSFKDLYLVYELMDTDLDRVIQSQLPLSSDHCRFFLFQLLEGLKYLHSVNVLHRDLKPGNLLVNANCDLKIGDFGLSRTMEENREPMTEYVVTRWYRAPELLLDCGRYGSCVDMWSVGCILAEILGRKPLFPGTDSLNQLHLIISVLGTPREKDLEFINCAKSREYIRSLPFSMGIDFLQLYPHADPQARHLLRKMLVFNPNKRISATEALRHPYMAELQDPNSAPPSKLTIDLDIDESVGEEKMRQMILKEILQHRLKDPSL